jgi:ribosomal protein S18 acetylase RimI-like enzyme
MGEAGIKPDYSCKDVMEKMILKRRDGSNIEAELKELDLSYINKIMKIQNDIYEGLLNKDFYFCSEQEEFENIINGKGKIFGITADENNELIAIAVYVEYGYDEENYGYDIQIKGEELLKVGQIESTIVAENYRGNKLQKKLCEQLEKTARDSGIKYICATVAPENKYSLNTFMELGYKISIEKLKYGGLRRYVLVKEFL